MVSDSPLTASCSLVDIDPDEYLVERLRLLDKCFYRSFKHDGMFTDLLELDDAALVEHFIRRGRMEGRIYNKRIIDYLDIGYYRKAYPDLGFASDSDARTHWMYIGVFEGRSPNRVTAELLNADIHLFQMGKVGSKSVQASIQLAHPSKLVPHLHFAHEMLLTYPDCYHSYPEIVRQHKGPIKFIAGIRDPFSRVVSGWLEAADSPNSSMNYAKALELVNSAGSNSEVFEEDLQKITDWFSHNFYCGIDVYSSTFDCESGYSIVGNGNHSVFVYRLDKLRGLWNQLSDFLGIPLTTMSKNRTVDKGHEANKVVEEANNLRLPRSIVENACNSRFMQHFFDSEYIDKVCARYSGPL